MSDINKAISSNPINNGRTIIKVSKINSATLDTSVDTDPTIEILDTLADKFDDSSYYFEGMDFASVQTNWLGGNFIYMEIKN
jgi:hypothetical protein